jgi:hypothetical protein
MSGPTRNDWKGLWSVLWRVLILGPIVGIFGLALLVLVIGAFVALPIVAVVALSDGDWFPGIAALGAWLVVMRFRRPLLRWTFEGFEYTGI